MNILQSDLLYDLLSSQFLDMIFPLLEVEKDFLFADVLTGSAARINKFFGNLFHLDEVMWFYFDEISGWLINTKFKDAVVYFITNLKHITYD